MLHATGPVLHLRAVARRGDIVARYRTAWDEAGDIVASQAVAWVLLDGTTITRRITLSELPPTLPAGSRVGTLIVTAADHRAEIPLITAAPINRPDLGWRLTRGF